MAQKTPWTKQDYLNWAHSISNARNPAQVEHDNFVIAQIRRFDAPMADLVQANTEAVDKVVAGLKTRLEPR